MKIKLITGIDGSGKSTIFEKLQKLNFASVAIVLVPKIDVKNISNIKTQELAISINQLGLLANEQNNIFFKSLNLFSSMVLFSDLCSEYKSKNIQTLFCERHPLIDAQIYAKFYAPLVNPNQITTKVVSYLETQFGDLLDFLLEKIDSKYLSNSNNKSIKIFEFIFKYFDAKKEINYNFLSEIFRTKMPDKIYFLNGDSNVFYERILSRKLIEAHEKKEVLQTLNKAYFDLFSNLKNIEIVTINANNFGDLNSFFAKLVNQITVKSATNIDLFPNVPGRGLVSEQSIKMRHEFLETLNFPLPSILKTNLLLPEIKNKIESFIGSVEIPLGLIGPLLFHDNEQSEMVYALGGTIEGALIASMNRGAKAISLSDGFKAHFVHQKMVRAPMFQFQSLADCVVFKSWCDANFLEIKKVCESFSNHAKLIEIKSLIISRSVHLNFIFETGDASGQNMTTTCTWHAMLWIVENFENQSSIKIKDYVIEGNCSSDKKVSSYSIQNVRGVHVIAECHLSETVIERVLRTSSTAIFNNYLPSISATRYYGMPEYNINVANAIAAIFVATGQDLACVHESSNAFLSLEKTNSGLYFSLTLPSLVIATIGGGTSLPSQKEALELMGCFGKEKIERFAKLIAGFALGLEISTYSAIVSGAFAKAHEKLGRNKPINWMTQSEINLDFIKDFANHKIKKEGIVSFIFDDKSIENGIITTLSGTVNNKQIGFFTIDLIYNNESDNKKMILKSKAIDADVIKGLHRMASQINPELSNLINQYQHFLEYNNCHQKEILMYEILSDLQIRCIPEYYGAYQNHEREAFFILQELLDENKMLLFNSENKQALWTTDLIKKTISTIAFCHQQLTIDNKDFNKIPVFNLNALASLYKKLLEITASENIDFISSKQLNNLLLFIENSNKYETILDISRVIIHNDFNPRNVAVRQDNSICIYDWELAVINIPHRDIVEFLAFTLPDDFDKEVLENYLKFHQKTIQNNQNWTIWKQGYIFALKEFLVARVTFYCTANIVLKLKFHQRILSNSLKMLSFLEN